MAKMFRYQHVRGAGITQLVEYQLPKLKVASSSLVARSISESQIPPKKTLALSEFRDELRAKLLIGVFG